LLLLRESQDGEGGSVFKETYFAFYYCCPLLICGSQIIFYSIAYKAVKAIPPITLPALTNFILLSVAGEYFILFSFLLFIIPLFTSVIFLG
jgi:hypothetical protein